MKQLAMPLACGMVLCASSAWAQVGESIVGFRATDPFYPAGTTFLDPGSKVSFTVRLAGNIIQTNPGAVPLPLLSYPSIQVRVGTSGSMRWAYLKPGGWNYSNHGTIFARTDLDFEYIVQPGDMADPQPLELVGSASIPFTFFGGDLVFVDAATGNTMVDADWKVNFGLWGIPIGVNDTAFTQWDLTMSQLGFKIKTLYFNTLVTPATLVASETKLCRIEMAAPSTTEAITLKVWTPDTANLLINGVGLDGAATVTIPLGATYVDFLVKGITDGTATIYAQRQTDFIKNPSPFVSEAGVTNFVKHVITITPPPDPTVRIIFPDNMGLDTLDIDESITPNTGTFKIALSETYPSNVYVAIDVINYPGQTNITLFPPTAGYYMVPANQTESLATYRFSAVDGTWDSEFGGVELKPTVTNAPADAYFTESASGTVFVKNVQPVTTVNIVGDPMKGIPYNIGWTVSDVSADLAAGIIMEWNFGDGSSSTVTNYSTTGAMSGVMTHTYLSDVPPVKNGFVTVREIKDLSKSTIVPFTVTVIPPITMPSVSIVMDSYVGTEGTNGWLWVVLSEICVDPVSVTWTAMLNGTNVVNTNLSFSLPSVVIPPGSLSNMVPVRVNFLDGTPETESMGIIIQSIITGTANAITQFPTTNLWPLYIMNKPPTLDNPKPSVAPLPPYHAIPLGLPYTFTADVNDASAADAAAGYILQWRVVGFTSWTTTNAFEYTFLNESLYNVEVRVKDKDMGDDSDWSGVSVTSFIVNVVLPPPDPSITVDCSIFVYPEMDPVTGAAGGGQFKVIMSQYHPDPVPITLTLIPPAGVNPGAITLGTTSFTFQPGQALERNIGFTIQDGTSLSEFEGFQVVASIPAGNLALNTFKVFNDGYIYVQNVPPIIRAPVAYSTNNFATVGIEHTFNWNIVDINADRAGLTNVWQFGDGQSATTYGANGTVTHIYQEAGDNLTVTLTSTDKDGGISTVIFFITVRDSKRVFVTPIGSSSADFRGMRGTGFGWIETTDFPGTSGTNLLLNIRPDYIHEFFFASTTKSAAFYANPLAPGESHYTPPPKNQLQGINITDQRSYFFVWDGDPSLFVNQNHATVPLSAGTTNGFTVLNLTGGQSTGQGGGGQDTDAIAINAIFSLEWFDGGSSQQLSGIRDGDCVTSYNAPYYGRAGDINQDGIPDVYVAWYFANNPLVTGGGGGGAGAIDPIWFQDLSGYNGDGDYLPRNPEGSGGVFDFRPIPYPGNEFTALLECRGNDRLLGWQINSIGLPYNDDPGTDPTVADTDKDGYPDGWEYWFWAAAYNRNRPGGRGGWRYDPENVAQGEYIDPRAIMEAFDPKVARGGANLPDEWFMDFDNDGLLCIEELILGTDPTNWDTDGDGMADGWEVLMGLNPCDPSDGLDIRFNNPDGDYFAIAAVPRVLVTIVTNDLAGLVYTNYFLARVGGGGQPLPGTYTTCYHYGDDNAPWAVGMPVADTNVNQIVANAVTLSTEVMDVLLLHFQVRDEFGYDPRTAWCGSVRRGPNMPSRFPPALACTAVADDPRALDAHNRLVALAARHGITRWGAFDGSDAPYTRAFTSVDEYLVMKFMYELRLNGAAALHAIRPEDVWAGQRKYGMRSRGGDDWLRFSTHPRTPDTSATPVRAAGVPDGWKLYVATAPGTYVPGMAFRHSPWNNLDGADVDADNDGLSLQREFWGTDSLAYYANPLQYSAVVPFAPGEIRPDTPAPEAAIILFRTGLTNNISSLGRVWTATMQGVVTIARPDGHGDNSWINKFWPTDPWDIDTDGDGLRDNLEGQYFIYGPPAASTSYPNPADNGSPCIPGGGLNPCSVDTDGDALPDGWEVCFLGTPTDNGNGTFSILNGMDGTVVDHTRDWDNDGLNNYEEYLTQAIRGFRYDIPDAGVPATDNPNFGWAGLPMDMTFEIADLFVEVTNRWDQARSCRYVPGFLWFMQSPEVPWFVLTGAAYPDGTPLRYASTDPRLADTDGDGMDDFYELYHGLNPLLGVGVGVATDRVAWGHRWVAPMYGGANWWVATYGFSMDFVRFPWLNGMPMADPDSDGLLNVEEMLLANSAAPESYNTDPSPMWMTDASNPMSLTARFYRSLGTGFYPRMHFWGTPIFMYPFEMNEGYDTDNDGISDKDELIGNRNPVSGPRDSQDPLRRQAMWFSGNNSAAVTPVLYNDLISLVGWNIAEMEQAFRSFTVELWVRPQRTVGFDQVLIERVFNYGPSDISMTESESQRRNFLIGIAPDGRVYAGYDNAGGHDAHTDSMRLFGAPIPIDQWTHLAARMDGRAGQFSLFVNGIAQDTINTTLIPVNGIMSTFEVPLMPGQTNEVAATTTWYYSGAMVLGAENNLMTAVGMGQILYPGVTSEILMPWAATWADYGKFYRGWMAEVRVWDGARTNVEINEDYGRRLTWDDMMDNRRLVLAQIQSGASRVKDAQQKLSPLLMNYYTFNSLFSALEPEFLATVPRGFNNPAVTINRPADANVKWWENTVVRSTVYDDYGYLPWIQNVVAHLPMYSVFTNDMTGTVTFGMNNVVADSYYWRTDWSGRVPADNSFPNRNNPYGFAHRSRVHQSADLLPLGDAFPRQCLDLWDGQGPTGPWLENSGTLDDGLPQWWINLHGTTAGWNDLYSGVNPLYQGMENGEAYQRDLMNGLRPDANRWDDYDRRFLQTADSDGDGLPDWWERLYGLDPFDATGDNGAGGDPDMDGLSNYAEYLISEVYKFRPSNPRKFKTLTTQKFSDYFERDYRGTTGKVPLGFIFSDHDFIEDWWEDMYAPTHANRFVYDPHIDYDWDGWSNWAEARYSQAVRSVRPDLAMQVMPNSSMIRQLPIPLIKTRLNYGGLQATGGNVVIQAFSDPSLNGVPDATWNLSFGTPITYSQPLGFFEPYTALRMRLTPGSLVPGTIQLRFTDMWTGATAVTGFDSGGVLYTTPVAGLGYEWIVGTVDYTTGETELDLRFYENNLIILDWDGYTNGVRTAVIDVDLSYVEIEYSALLPDVWPQDVYLGLADSGYLREGTNYFVAYMTQPTAGGGGGGAGTAVAPPWLPGYPFGVATPFGTDVGWDMNTLNIEMTDYTPGYLRISLASGLRTEEAIFGNYAGNLPPTLGAPGNSVLGYHVRVVRTHGLGPGYQRYVLEKTIVGRDYLHEGDFLNDPDGGFGVNWGHVEGAEWEEFRVVLGETYNFTNAMPISVFTNDFKNHIPCAKAVPVMPANGGYVYSARPTFRWSMPEGYTAFAIELRKNSTSSGSALYPVTVRQVPLRDPNTGHYIWEAPFYIGDQDKGLVNNALYYWRVVALNARNPTPSSGTWSDWQMFRWDVNQPVQSSGYGQVNALVKYLGPAVNLANKVVVEAYDNRGFTGNPAARYVLPSVATVIDQSTTATNAFLRGLVPGTYYLRAFIDSNGNGVRDIWESWGYANYYGQQASMYNAYPVKVEFSAKIPWVTIMIEDCDVDQDWFMDAWEYEQNPGAYPGFLNKIYPPGGEGVWSFGDTEINPFLSLSAGWFGWDSAGMLPKFAPGQTQVDFLSMLAGLGEADDGFTGVQKMSLGLLSSDTLGLRITKSPVVNPDTAEVTWEMSLQRDKSDGALVAYAFSGQEPAKEFMCRVVYKLTLDDPKWEPASDWVKFTLDEGVTPPKTTLMQNVKAGIDVTRGFFRVEVEKAQ